MQQRQLRLGDILDDYCPRERRLTNHAVVAMIGDDVKQTRCTTCDAEHEYKHAKVPRQRRKSETPAALYSQVAAGRTEARCLTNRTVPKRRMNARPSKPIARTPRPSTDVIPVAPFPVGRCHRRRSQLPRTRERRSDRRRSDRETTRADPGEEGPVHRPLIRATLPRQEGQPPPTRPARISRSVSRRGRRNRFRPRHQRGGQQFFGQPAERQHRGGSLRGGRRVKAAAGRRRARLTLAPGDARVPASQALQIAASIGETGSASLRRALHSSPCPN